MKPKRIFLVRHGQSEGNVNKEIYRSIPDYALKLTPLGKEQAINAGKELKSIIGDERVKFYVSPFWRTRQTFQGIGKSFDFLNYTNYYEDPRLREQEWHGKLPIDGYGNELEEERDLYGHFYYRFDGGESCADVYDRVSDFLNTLNREFEKPNFPPNVIIISHGMAMRVLIMRWFHETPEVFETWANPKNCEIIQLDFRGDINKYCLKNEMRLFPKRTHNFQFDWKAFDKI